MAPHSTLCVRFSAIVWLSRHNCRRIDSRLVTQQWASAETRQWQPKPLQRTFYSFSASAPGIRARALASFWRRYFLIKYIREAADGSMWKTKRKTTLKQIEARRSWLVLLARLLIGMGRKQYELPVFKLDDNWDSPRDIFVPVKRVVFIFGGGKHFQVAWLRLCVFKTTVSKGAVIRYPLQLT